MSLAVSVLSHRRAPPNVGINKREAKDRCYPVNPNVALDRRVGCFLDEYREGEEMNLLTDVKGAKLLYLENSELSSAVWRKGGAISISLSSNHFIT